jgi:hypothetical protein
VRSEDGGDALDNGSAGQRDTVSWATPQARKQGYDVGRRPAGEVEDGGAVPRPTTTPAAGCCGIR